MIDALFELLGRITNAVQPLLYGGELSVSLLAVVLVAGLVAGVTPFGLTTIVFLSGRISSAVATSAAPSASPSVPVPESAKRQAFHAAALFALGAALSLFAAGAAAAYAGKVMVDYRVAKYLPVVTLVMGLYLLGLWRWRLPARFWGSPERQRSSFLLLGLPFGIVTAPCTAPIVVTVLGVVAASGNLLFGGVVLLAFAAGRSIPLVAACTYSGTVLGHLERRRGAYRVVNKLLGAVIVAASVYFLTVGRSFLGA